VLTSPPQPRVSLVWGFPPCLRCLSLGAPMIAAPTPFLTFSPPYISYFAVSPVPCSRARIARRCFFLHSCPTPLGNSPLPALPYFFDTWPLYLLHSPFFIYPPPSQSRFHFGPFLCETLGPLAFISQRSLPPVSSRR